MKLPALTLIAAQLLAITALLVLYLRWFGWCEVGDRFSGRKAQVDLFAQSSSGTGQRCQRQACIVFIQQPI